MGCYLICPHCGTKIKAKIIKKDVSQASWGGDYDYTGSDAVNKCTTCGDEHSIRADFWLDNYTLKDVTNAPFPESSLTWYALAEVREVSKPDKKGVGKDFQINIYKIFTRREEAEKTRDTQYQYNPQIQLIAVTAEGFRHTEGYLLKDPYQKSSVNLSRVTHDD